MLPGRQLTLPAPRPLCNVARWFYWLKSLAAISAEFERGDPLGGRQKAWLLPA
jgi:hypothetical protein